MLAKFHLIRSDFTAYVNYTDPTQYLERRHVLVATCSPYVIIIDEKAVSAIHLYPYPCELLLSISFIIFLDYVLNKPSPLFKNINELVPIQHPVQENEKRLRAKEKRTKFKISQNDFDVTWGFSYYLLYL